MSIFAVGHGAHSLIKMNLPDLVLSISNEQRDGSGKTNTGGSNLTETELLSL